MTLAVCEPRPILTVELSQLSEQAGCGARLAERTCDLPDDLRVAVRVEPDVRIGDGFLALGTLQQLLAGQQVDGPIVALDRLLQRRHEPLAEVEHRVGAPHVLDVARGQLEVVRLGPRRRQIVDFGAGSTRSAAYAIG
jgi:hypothetical protein